jgi:hypothetical protein
MKLYTLFIGFTLISFLSFSQDKEGYYGNKHYVSLETVFYSPLIYNARSGYLLDEQTFLYRKKDRLNYGFHASITQIIKRNFAFSLELGIDNNSLYADREVSNYDMDKQSEFLTDNYYSVLQNSVNPATGESYYYSDNYNKTTGYVDHENIDSRTITVMPKIELSNKKALLPLGLAHQIGFGFSSTKILEKEYNAANDSYYDYSSNSLDITEYKKYFYDYKNAKNIITYKIMYGIYKKTPITKNLMIQFGVRYTLNLRGKYKYDVADFESPYYYTNNDMRSLVYRQQFSNFISASLGVTYVFK